MVSPLDFGVPHDLTLLSLVLVMPPAGGIPSFSLSRTPAFPALSGPVSLDDCVRFGVFVTPETVRHRLISPGVARRAEDNHVTVVLCCISTVVVILVSSRSLLVLVATVRTGQIVRVRSPTCPNIEVDSLASLDLVTVSWGMRCWSRTPSDRVNTEWHGHSFFTAWPIASRSAVSGPGGLLSQPARSRRPAWSPFRDCWGPPSPKATGMPVRAGRPPRGPGRPPR